MLRNIQAEARKFFLYKKNLDAKRHRSGLSNAFFFYTIKNLHDKITTTITYKLLYIHDKKDTPGNNNYDYPGAKTH